MKFSSDLQSPTICRVKVNLFAKVDYCVRMLLLHIPAREGPAQDSPGLSAETSYAMQLSEITNSKSVKVPLEAGEKYAAITELVQLLDEAGVLNDYEAALKAVVQREGVRSTGVGQGFAIPHGKSSAVDKLVMAVGKTKTPIDFESIDKQPVDLIFLLVSPLDQTGPHIQALARISRLMTDPESRRRVDESATAEELYGHLADLQA